MAEFSDYSWLTTGAAAAWLDRLAVDPRPPLQQLAELRREMSAERARLLVDQADLRRRAAAKFGDLAGRMLFTRVLLEQATDRWIARYKASRIEAARPTASIGDYCCGIGGDLMAFAASAAATGWDRSETARVMAEANLSLIDSGINGASSVRCGDAQQLAPDRGEVWHLDPDRRAGGGRASQVCQYEPGPELIDRWLELHHDGAVKLAPAAEAPTQWLPKAELEWISSQGECRQLVAWFGTMASAEGQRRATRVSAGPDGGTPVGTLTGSPELRAEISDSPLGYLYDPDAAVLAARLLGTLASKHGLQTLGAGGAYLTGDRLVADALMSPFAVEACLPLREAPLRKYLAERGVGVVEIKKRGVDLNPELLRSRLKLRGSESAVIVLTRIGRRQVAIVASRPEQPGVSEAAISG